MTTDPTSRFSSRVEHYIKYRPGYPQQVIQTLRERCGLSPNTLVADIGSGTGLLTELFLLNGNTVFGVEPNTEMRLAGEELLQNYRDFHSIRGRAEATTLPDQSMDFVIAGQAFHWFDRQSTRREFARILKPGGWVMLVWNERETRSEPFLRAYELLLQKYATDYAQVDHRQIDERVLAQFYGQGGFEARTYPNRQKFDYTGVEGRLLSSSYSPEPGHPDYEPMLLELMRIFQAYQESGYVRFEYTTRMYYGRLG